LAERRKGETMKNWWQLAMVWIKTRWELHQYGKMKGYLWRNRWREWFYKTRKEFEGRPELVDKIIEESLVKCRARAEETMKEVREKIGLI